MMECWLCGGPLSKHDCPLFDRLIDYWFRCSWPVYLERKKAK